MSTTKKAHSFDVFDTCVSRRLAYPRDLFYLLGLELALPGLSADEREGFAQHFRRLRIRAEKSAYRSALPRQGATLADIYRHFELPEGLNLSIADVLDTEVGLERQNIYAVPEILAELERLRRQGKKLIFVSDMYLPASILSPLLADLGIKRTSENLYVSCDAGLSKHSGRLYTHVLETENLKPAEVLHVGDNLWADVRMPETLGIAARHFQAAALTSHERAIAGHKVSTSIQSSTVAAFSRQSRLAAEREDGDAPMPLDDAIHAYITPLLISYVAWVLEQAHEAGIKRLYFVARDGEVMHKIASRLQGSNQSIELRYLYGSRRAWLMPSIIRTSSTWKKLIATPGQSNARSDVLARIGLSPEEQSQIRSTLGLDEKTWHAPLDKDEAYAFMEAMLQDGTCAGLIFKVADEARKVALRYFEQEGLLEEVPWALVDAGWSLNCQAALKRILSAVKGAEFSPSGYYLALSRDHLGPGEAGTAWSYIQAPGSLFSRRRVIIEHCFTPSTHATTKSYELRDGRAVPKFGTELRGEQELAYAARLHRIAERSAALLADQPALRERLLSSRDAIIRNAERFISRPTRAAAEQMSSFGTIADLRHEKGYERPLCEPMGLADLWTVMAVTVSKKSNFGKATSMWLEGSAAISPFYIRTPIRMMLWIDSTLQRLKNP